MDKKVTVLVAVGCSGKQEAVAVTVPVAVLVAVILSGGQWADWLVISHWGGGRPIKK